MALWNIVYLNTNIKYFFGSEQYISVPATVSFAKEEFQN